MTALDRFFAKVSPEPNSGCWLWTGTLTSDGYGIFTWGGRRERAHRAAWKLTGRVIPEGLVIDHLCRVRCCVNPDHMRVCTIGENVRAGIHRNRRKFRCDSGHDFDAKNTGIEVVNGATWRYCRACKLRRMRATRERQRNVPRGTFAGAA